MADQIELADDGSPLGTLKIGDQVFVPKRQEDGTVVTYADKEREALEDLTGEHGADEDLMALYENYSDPVLRRRALELYVRDGLSAEEVAQRLKVPVETVEMWAYNGKWNRAAGRSVAVRAQEEARGLTALRIKVRKSIIESQLEGSRRIRERVLQDMDEMSAKSAAEALKAAADVEARALGMSESGSIANDDQTGTTSRQKKGDDKVPLVLVVNNGVSASGILPVRKPGQVIDVEESK